MFLFLDLLFIILITPFPSFYAIMMIFNKIFKKSFIIATVTLFFLFTYIHNWPLQPFSQDYGLASHTTHVVCVNFIRECGTYSLTSTPNDRFFEKLFHGSFYLLSEFLPEICWEKVAEEIFFIFHFWWLTLDTNPGFCV